MEALVTERLVLTPLQRTDVRVLHALYGDAEIMRHITGRARTPFETGARLRKDLRHHREHGFGLCLGRRRDDDAVVGRFGVEPKVTARGLEGELAWMLHREHRGRGYATEAARALIDFARTLGLARIFAVTDPANEASLRVMQRLGLVEVEGQDAGRVFVVGD